MSEIIFEVKNLGKKIIFYEEYINVYTNWLIKKTDINVPYEDIKKLEINKLAGLYSLMIKVNNQFLDISIESNINDFENICIFLEQKTKLHILDPLNFLKRKEPEDVKCPKCNSTQFLAGNKKLDGKRALVGGVILGPAGMVLGGLTSKKIKLTCLNCGHNWSPGNLK